MLQMYAIFRCGHCKNLAPVFAEAAYALVNADPKVHLAKLDATQNEAVAKAYNVQGFPTLKWFVNGSLTVRSMHSHRRFAKHYI